MPLDENEAWELWRAAIQRWLDDPGPRNLAEKNRCGRLFKAVFCPEQHDEPSEREAA